MARYTQTAFGTQGIQGLDTVMSNLNKEIEKIQGASIKGIREAIKLIHDDMDKTPPLIPEDTGALKKSWKTQPIRMPGIKGVLFGFFAEYALWVHEMIGADFKSTRKRYGPGEGKGRVYTPRPGAGAKFFESSIKRNKDKILDIIRQNAKI